MSKLDRRDLYVALVLLLLWSLFFWRYLTPVKVDRVAFTRGDLSEHFYVLHSFAFDDPMGEPFLFKCEVCSMSTPSRLVGPHGPAYALVPART